MSSETRLVRPYVGGEEFQKMLDSCTLRCADEVVEGGGEVSVNLDEYLNYPFALLMEDIDWALAEAGATALELEPGDIDLLVLVAAPRLRFVDTIFRRDLSEVGSMPDHVPLSYPERPRALRAPHGGADLRVYFCLNKHLNPRPLSPWRKGTWLGQQEYRVRSDLSGSGFVPIRMTDDDREHLGIPKDTARFVTLDDGDPFDIDPPTDIVKLYVDGDLLDRLAVATSTPVGKHIQRQLFLDATSAIVFAAHRRFAEDPGLGTQHVDDFRGSLVHKLTEVVASKGMDSASRDQRQTEFCRLRDTPTAFLAQIEAKTGMRKDMLASFGDIA
jgi:hypothetical protein